MPLVMLGIVDRDAANECLKLFQAATAQGKKVSLLGLMVRRGLMTKLQAQIFNSVPLEKVQPFDDYKLIRKVGEGGMAHVYEATYLPVDARVALKILQTEFGLQERFRLRFKREAYLLMSLEHPNIVEGREWATQHDVDFYAMGCVDGVAVYDLLEKGIDLDEGLVLHIACQVGDALEHMRERGVVHRDVKPHNFVLDQHGKIVMIDFGLAKLMQGMREDTAEDVTVGTVEYMSPEQCKGSKGVDFRSDIYSLGVSLFHMLTGDLPFNGDGEEVMFGHVKLDLEFTEAQRARISPQVQFVIRKMMAKEPDDRYATPAEFVEDLRAVAGTLIENRGPVPPEVLQSAAEEAPIPDKQTSKAPVSGSRRPGSAPVSKRAGRRSGRRRPRR